MDRIEVLRIDLRFCGWVGCRIFGELVLLFGCSSGRIGWAVRIGRRPVVMRGVVSRWELWCGRSDHVDTGCRGLGGSRGACRIVPIVRSLGRHLAGWSGTVEFALGLLILCIGATGLTHGLARGNRLAR